MTPLFRLGLLIDITAPEAAHRHLRAAVAAWRRWGDALTQEVSLEVLIYGARASWVVGQGGWAEGAPARAVATSGAPSLGAALALLEGSARSPQALVLAMHREPAPGWEGALKSPVAATLLSSPGEPPAAAGSGHLGAIYGAEHALEALQWATTHLRDRHWRCPCGEVHALGSPCERGTPPRLRVGDRVLALYPGQRIFPHHLGRPLRFDEALAQVDAHPAGDGRLGLRNLTARPWRTSGKPCPPGKAVTLRHGLTLTLDGVKAEVRATAPSTASAFRPTQVASDGHCAACGGAVFPVGLQVPPDPRLFCQPCVTSGDACDTCSLPLGSRGVDWPDGRRVCRACYDSAITDIEDLTLISQWARRWLAENLAMHTEEVPLHFADAATIARMHGRTFVRRPGGTPREIGFYRLNPPAIYVEYGCPRNEAFGLMVHEWTHAWQVRQWAPSPTTRVSLVAMEGLAMWAETEALRSVGAAVEVRRAEQLGGVYAAGLALYRAVAKEVGFSAVPRVDPRSFVEG